VEKKDYVLMGKIVSAHGVKGTNKFRSFAERLTVFKPGDSILVCGSQNYEKKHEINWVKPHTGTPLISFKGVTDRSQAEVLIGCELFIKKSELPEVENGSYYWSDLIGLHVFKTDKTYLGCIESIIQTGSNDVYVVKDGIKEVLVPALESVVLKIDIENNQMQVDLPEGLEEDI
jgi:16S rRNA processing protein RimM